MNDLRKAVNKVMNDADVILLVLDARLVNETRNSELEKKVKELGKLLIYVITKSDLIEDKKSLEKYKEELKPCVFISASKYYGVNILKETIMIESKRQGIKSLPVKVGVIGYPNVGKSSLINAMTGKGSARVSSTSGQTRGVQKVKVSRNIIFLDTPGVIPVRETDETKHAIMGSVDYDRTKEPDLAVMRLMGQYPGKIEKFYGVETSEDFEETIEEIARKKNIIGKNSQPDTNRMAREILRSWQTGKIK